MQHDGVLRLLGNFQDAACVYFVLQFAAGGELFRSIKQRGGRCCPPCPPFTKRKNCRVPSLPQGKKAGHATGALAGRSMRTLSPYTCSPMYV